MNEQEERGKTAPETEAPILRRSYSSSFSIDVSKVAQKAQAEEPTSSAPAVTADQDPILGGANDHDLTPCALTLFSARMDEIPERYYMLGENTYEKSAGCPLPLCRVQVLKDRMSEQKLLRLAFYAPAVPVVGVRLQVALGGASCALGTFSEVVFTEEFFGADEEVRTATVGLVLPEGVLGGEITVRAVCLADGLDWEKGSAPYAFRVQKLTGITTPSVEEVQRAYATVPTLPTRMLPLFSASAEEVPERYTVLGETAYETREDGPLHVRQLQLLCDTVSEKKLLRLAFYPSAFPIVGAHFEVLLRDAHGEPLGVLRDVRFDENAVDEKGDLHTAAFGFLLPDGVACGELLITSATLTDGLTWTSGHALYPFTSEEMRAVDVEFFCQTIGAEIPQKPSLNLLTYRIAKADAYVRSVCVCEGENAYLEVTCMNSGNMVIRRLSLSVTYTDADGREVMAEPVLFDTPIAPTQVSEVLRLPLPQGVKEGMLSLRVAQDSFMRLSLVDHVPFATYESMVSRGAAWRRDPSTIPNYTIPTPTPPPAVGDPFVTEPPSEAEKERASILPLALAIAAAVLSLLLLPFLF